MLYKKSACSEAFYIEFIKGAHMARVTHMESGAVGEYRANYSRVVNARIAWERCIKTPKFKAWHRLQTKAKLQGTAIYDMLEKESKIEQFVNGQWLPYAN